MNNPLKLILWVDDVAGKKVAVIKLVLIIVEMTPPNENKLNTYILIKKYNIISKAISSNLSSEQICKTQDKFEYNNALLS